MTLREEDARQCVDQVASKHLAQLGELLEGSLEALVDTRADPAQAVLEIVQNADDAGVGNAQLPSKPVSLELNLRPDGLTVHHDGYDFSPEDVEGIASIKRTTKSAERHIGFMGIGFKSVYKLASAAYVKSGPFCFQFHPSHHQGEGYGWIVVPRWCAEFPVEGVLPSGTTIHLPYLEDTREEIRPQVEAAAIKLPAVCLMFLSNLTEVRVVQDGKAIRTITRTGYTVTDQSDDSEEARHFSIFDRTLEVPTECKQQYRVKRSGRDKAKERRVRLLFERDNVGGLRRSAEESSLYAFLPTLETTRLPFLIQADFILDSQRERIDRSLRWNGWLLESASGVLLDAIKVFKLDPATKHQFLGVLPQMPDTTQDEYIAKHLLDPMWAGLRTSKVARTRTGRWIVPSVATLPSDGTRAEDFQRLVDDAHLFEIKGTAWVHPNTRGIGLLRELGASSFAEGDLVEALTDSTWLRSKSKRWFGRLLSFLEAWRTRQPAAWANYRERLRIISFVPTIGGTLAPPTAVMFPPTKREEQGFAIEVPGIQIIETSVAQGRFRELLMNLGVGDFELEQIVRRTLLPQIEQGEWARWTADIQNAVVGLLKSWLRSLDWRAPPDLRSSLEKVPLPCADGRWYPCSALYVKTPALERIDRRLKWVERQKDRDWERFVTALGVLPWLRLTIADRPASPWSPPNGPRRWHEYSSAKLNNSGRDHEITGVSWLAPLESRLTPAKAAALAEMVVDGWARYYSRFRQSRHRYFHYSQKVNQVESYFYWQLRSSAWLPTTKGIRKPDSSVFVPDPTIERVYGKLAPTIRLPADLIARGRDLWQALNLSTSVNPEATVRVLAEASQIKPSTSVRTQLARIYAHLGQEISTLTAEDDEAAAGWRKALRRAPLLRDSGHFVAVGSGPAYWADASEGRDVFADAFDAVWCPTGIERPVVGAFFDACSVRRLSNEINASLDIAAVPPQQADARLNALVRERRELLLSSMVHFNPRRRDEIKSMLRKLRALRCDVVPVIYELNGVERKSNVPAFLDRDGSRMYLTGTAGLFDASLELCRAYSIDRLHASTLAMALELPIPQALTRLEESGIAGIKFKGLVTQADSADTSPGVSDSPPPSSGIAKSSLKTSATLDRTPSGSGADSTVTSSIRPSQSGLSSESRPPDVPSAPLPDLNDVSVELLDYALGSGAPRARQKRTFRLGANPSGKTEPPARRIDPKKIGDRAEAIVAIAEQGRLSARGKDPDVFLKRIGGQADHDFESVDDLGEVIFIEAKAASADGAFQWTGNEFDLARRTRGQYYLYLVFGSGTTSARVVPYRDPVALIDSGELYVDYHVLQGRAPLPAF